MLPEEDDDIQIVHGKCDACGVSFRDGKTMAIHFASKKHLRRVK